MLRPQYSILVAYPMPPEPQDERGVSRDEMAEALVEIGEGRVPNDRIALKCLHEEMTQWPFLEVAADSAAASKEAEAPAAKPSASDYASLMGGGCSGWGYAGWRRDTSWSSGVVQGYRGLKSLHAQAPGGVEPRMRTGEWLLPPPSTACCSSRMPGRSGGWWVMWARPLRPHRNVCGVSETDEHT